MWRTLHDAWQRQATGSRPHSYSDTLFAGVLQSGAFLYGLVVRARNLAYDRRWIRPVRLTCPVISVGNLEVGGTGKTACVEWLAQSLQQAGVRVAILSRGYGTTRPTPYHLLNQDGRLLLDGQPVAEQDRVADEPRLLACHLPGASVLVGPRRAQTGRQACTRWQAQAILLDDGFQHRQLHRDCDIVLIHARMPLGGRPLFPRGTMREPLGALRRADIIIITKVDESLPLSAALQERLRSINPTAPICTAVHEPVGVWEVSSEQRLGVDSLERRRVYAVSSIGDPEGFEHTLSRMGAVIAGHAASPDHHGYTASEWAQIVQGAGAQRAEAIATTEKDWVRLSPLVDRSAMPVPVWVLQIQFRLMSAEAEFHARLAAVLHR